MFDSKRWLMESEEKFAEAFEKDDFGGDFEELPAGEYQVRVESAILKESKNLNKMIEWQFEVSEGKYKKRKVWKHHVFNSENRANQFRQELKKLGVDPGKWIDINSTLKSLLDKELEIEVKYTISDGKNFPNIKIVSLAKDDLPF